MTVAADPVVGPLFPRGLGSGDHECTGAVLAGAADLVLTAAHCVSGTGVGTTFVPGYDGTARDPAPFGEWRVVTAWVPAGWRTHADEADDYAILRVAGPAGTAGRLAHLTGGGVELGDAAPAGAPVWVPAYAAGSGDAPVACTATVYLDDGHPAFDCEGYPGGTSGAPWLAGATGTAGPGREPVVVGLIGGHRQGGCETDTSYSPPWDAGMLLLLVRALLRLPGDDVPAAPDDGC
ncbi:trypsin-like serine peptidase [Nakamurella endophytica]|uniref:Uncharacterized protein n=1 Tax=Nakamurella endophytica TaxID=1748367 RepID=A0A917WCA1_9ACTN|nr:trypsin-like peptidase domain-containing protein [Nakamurella endophytica]GGL92074.1 hypothetical protein GCM10011594_09780 [Nakamurella endophytica]